MANKTTKRAKSYATHITLPTGERVYVRGKTKEERDAKVLQAKLEMRMGVDITDNTLFRDYAYAWLKAYKSPPKLRESSYVTVKNNLEKHIIPFFGAMRLREVRPMQVQLFLSSIAHLSRSVQSKCLQMVRAIFRTAEDNGLIPKSPVRKEDTVSGSQPEEEEALSNEQARALLSAVRNTRAYPFCLIALSTGMRRGEILGLMWEDIDFDAGVINVTHNKAYLGNCNDAPVTTVLKTDAARRRIPVPPVLLAYLEQERKASDSPYVLSMSNGNSLTKASFRKLWAIVEARSAVGGRQVGDKVQGSQFGRTTVTLDFSCHPHQLRHTYITQLFEAGLDIKQVQYLAGHSTPEMTLKVYTHYRRRSREAETAQKVKCATNYLAI